MAQLLLLVDLIGLLALELFMLAEPKITQDLPSSMAPGSEARVTVTIDKGELTGFAKLQIDLPEGFTCTALETKGASFTFSDQKAKFIWMALPDQPSFKVTYSLAAPATASGQQPIAGRFSYILDNERRTFELPAAMITITGAAVAAAPPAQESTNDVAAVSDAAPVPVASGPVAVTTEAQGAGGVTVERRVTPTSATEALVELTISKGDIRGFGKLQENLPAGFTAVSRTNAEAIFTTQDRIAKFVWLNLPADGLLKVAYTLRASAGGGGAHTVSGEFGYLVNDETQRVAVAVSSFNLGNVAQELADTDAAKQAGAQATAAAEAAALAARRAAEAEAAAAAAAARPPARTAPQRTPAAGGIPAPESGIVFRVQITAAHREVGGEYFASRHGFHESFNIERHEGWIKYTTGSFTQYQEARNKRASLISAGHRLPGPFVTAYNNGQRITVQEALMITNQGGAE